MTELELHAMYAAHCRCCLLSAAMKDCAHCVFNVLEPATPSDATRALYGDGPEEWGVDWDELHERRAHDAAWYAEMEAQSRDANDLRATEEGARI